MGTLKSISFKQTYNPNLISMSEMKPLELGIIKDTGHFTNNSNGKLVMRTSSVDIFEIMLIEEPQADSYYTFDVAKFHKVELVKGELTLNFE